MGGEEGLGCVGREERLLIALLQPLVFGDRQEHVAGATIAGDDHRLSEGDIAIVGELADKFASGRRDALGRWHVLASQ